MHQSKWSMSDERCYVSRPNNVEVSKVPYPFTEYPYMGEHLKEINKGGADVVIDCDGMNGKKSHLN